MIKREDDGLWVVLSETIASHHEEVLACLTTSGGLTRWFPVAAEVDLRKGGSITLGWDEKMSRTTTIKVMDFNADGRMTWAWHPNRHPDLEVPVHWAVEPSVEEGSKVTLSEGPFDPAQTEMMIAMAEEAESWRWQLCNLRTVLEVKHDMRRVRPL